MDMIVYLNGSFVKAQEAGISIYDRGFLYGDGVFETLRVYKRHIFMFEEHMRRMHNSLKCLGIGCPAEPNRIRKTIELLLRYNGFQDAYVRVTVTRGEGPIGLGTSLSGGETVLVVTEPPHMYSMKEMNVHISSVRKVPDDCIPGCVKSCNYLVNILARREAEKNGAGEAILLNMEGYAAEGTVSNIFLGRGGKLLTPALTSGILDGITRGIVIELAEKRGIEVIERHILPSEIFSAEECFLTNTSMEVMPVVSCTGRVIGSGRQGKITLLLKKDFKRFVEREILKERKAGV